MHPKGGGFVGPVWTMYARALLEVECLKRALASSSKEKLLTIKGRLGVPALTLTLLAAPMLTASASAGGSSGQPDWLSEVRDSRSISSPVAVQGSVKTSNGSGPASGAEVYLQAWPNAESLAQLEVGDFVAPTPIGKTVADASGRYRVRIDPNVDVEHLKSQLGTLDVEVVAMHDGDIVVHGFPIFAAERGQAADSQAVYVHPRTGEVLAPMTAALVMGKPAATRRGGTVDEAWDDGGTPPNPADVGGDAEQPSTGGGFTIMGHYNGSCPGGEGLKTNFGLRAVNVGEIAIAAYGKKMRFTYQGAASSTLGYALSSTGGYGSWSASGTVSAERSSGSTNTTTFPWYTNQNSRYLDTYFSYGKFCVQYYDSVHGVGHRYQTRRIRHEGGTNARSATIPATPSSYCVPYRLAGSTETKANTDAITWTNGAKLSGAIGIDLSSRTGFRTDAKMEFEFTTPGRLCGTHDTPNGTPRRLVMRAP